ncbi:hypothetical protein [Aureispira anguillae]|nr:hypothetical protein [Aureispira anguillae]
MANLAKSQHIDSKNQRDILKAQEAYEQVPYCQEYRGLKNIGDVLSVLASFCSWHTQAFGLGFLTFMWLSGFLNTAVAMYMGVALGVVGSSIIEALKRIISKLFFKNYFDSKKDTSLKLGASIVLVLAASIGLSFYASLYIPNMVVDAPKLADITRMEASFDKDITELQTERNTYRKNREYKGKLRSKDANTVLLFNEKIEALKKEKKAALKTAKASNKELVNNWVTENNDNGLSIGWFMVLLEILCIGGIAFHWHYKSIARLDGSPAPEPTPPLNKQPKRKGFKSTSTKDLNNQQEVGEPAEQSHDNCLTTNATEKTDSSTIVDLEAVEIFDNDTVDKIKRLKDAISKNYERSFTSKAEETRANNFRKAKERAVVLEDEYGIVSWFSSGSKKVHFSTLQTA